MTHAKHEHDSVPVTCAGKLFKKETVKGGYSDGRSKQIADPSQLGTGIVDLSAFGGGAPAAPASNVPAYMQVSDMTARTGMNTATYTRYVYCACCSKFHSLIVCVCVCVALNAGAAPVPPLASHKPAGSHPP